MEQADRPQPYVHVGHTSLRTGECETMRATATSGLARRLVMYEAGESPYQGSLTVGAERVSANLNTYLSRTIGREGFRTLLARALTLTVAQFPAMDVVNVEADGRLAGLRQAADAESQENQTSDVLLDEPEGVVALVANFLGLLNIFIGEDLTLRIVHRMWPQLDLDDSEK